MTYDIRWRRSAERDLRHLPPDAQVRVVARVEALADNPQPSASEPLLGVLAGLRRLRVGEYRIPYIVDEAERMVGIVAVGHRNRFYNDLGRGGV